MKVFRRYFVYIFIVRFYIVLIWSIFALIPVFAVIEGDISLLVLIIPTSIIFILLTIGFLHFCDTRIVIEDGFLDLTHYNVVPPRFRVKIRVDEIVSIEYIVLKVLPSELFGGRIYEQDYFETRLIQSELGYDKNALGSYRVYCRITDVYSKSYIVPFCIDIFIGFDEELIKINTSIKVIYPPEVELIKKKLLKKRKNKKHKDN